MGKSRSNAAISAPSAITLLPSGERISIEPPVCGKDGLAKVVQSENGSVEIQWVTLVGVDDVAGIHRPGVLELGQVLLRQHITEAGVARREGKDRARVVGVDEGVELRECAAPSGRQLWQPQPRRIGCDRERRSALETVDVAGSITRSGADAGVHVRIMRDEQVQVRRFSAANDPLDEVADDRKACSHRQGAHVDDDIGDPLQAPSAEDVDDVASADDCTVLRPEYVDGRHLPVGEHGEKSLPVRGGSVRLIPGRIASFLLDEQGIE